MKEERSQEKYEKKIYDELIKIRLYRGLKLYQERNKIII